MTILTLLEGLDSMTNYGFFFEELRNGMPEGISDSSEETFRGSPERMANALVRELAQNSLDAKLDGNDEPVHMVFELRNISTREIPDFANLKAHIASANRYNSDDPSNTRLKDAETAINSKTLPVLRVSDYNTKGLSGNENDKGSTLRALTYYAGKSADKKGSGGSYGIGKAVGIATSSIRTELWTTKAVDTDEVVFTGYSRLATHSDPNNPNIDLMASGIYTDKDVIDEEGLHYCRNTSEICGFPARKESGTDLYILGYILSEDSQLKNLRDALIDNFLVAIHRGRLVVEGISNESSWKLDSETLPEMIDTDRQQAFFEALSEEPITVNDKYLGEMKLYFNMGRNLPERYGVYGVRKPLMKIHDFDIRAIRMNYAAIFECSSTEGNDLLRKMEPPSHDKWEARTSVKNAKTIMKHITDFIKKTLKEQQEKEFGEKIEIPGLNLLLPSNANTDVSAPTARIHGGGTQASSPTTEESSTLQGRINDNTPVFNREKDKVQAVITKPAVAKDTGPTTLKGKDQGGNKKRGKHVAGIPGHGLAGNGHSEIHSDQVSMRTLYHTEDHTYTLILRTKGQNPVQGLIRLTATVDGHVDPTVVLHIEHAEDITSGSPKDLPIIDKTAIGDIYITHENPTRIKVKIFGGQKMQLAVI